MSWSDLPAGLVAAIADELTEPANLARFRSVCPSWRSASAAHAARHRGPLLLLPTEWYNSRVNRRVWSLADDRLREMPVPAALSHAFLFASHRGWMLAVARDLKTATLVYPFTGDSAGLPVLPFSTSSGGDDYEREKVLRDLAWDWSPHGIVVASPSGKGAFFCRPGADESWRPIGRSSAVVTSVTYCHGSFYLFDGRSCVATVVDAETQAVVAEITSPAALDQTLPRSWNLHASLAVSRDEILLIVQTELLHGALTSGWPRLVKAFRADRASPGSSWSEVAGVGDRAVFVDHLRAFCVEADGTSAGVRRNCVYFASSHEVVNDDYGIDVCGRYTVRVLDLADLSKEDLWHGNLSKVCCTRFWQWPSWSLRELHSSITE